MTTSSAIDAALEQIDEWLQPRGVGGVGAAVWHGGAIVAERYAGEARQGQPVDEGTLFALASVTKPVTAATVMSLVDEGAIGLDDTAARIVPTFAAGPARGAEGVDEALEAHRGEVTVRQLLCHTSGLPEDMADRKLRLREQPDLATLTDALCQAPLRSMPGSHLHYSNAGYAVLARLAEHLGRDEFWEMTRARILDPLGLDDIVARPSDAELERVVHVADTANAGTAFEAYNSAYWRDLAIPWGGFFGTPRAAVRFAAAFLPGSPVTAGNPLSAGTIAAMTSDHAGGVPGGVESGKVWWDHASWGLGWEVKGTKQRHWTGQRTSPETFCHFGQAGTLLWADPSRDLALAVFTTRTVTRMWGFILSRWIRLSDALVELTNG
ncbi:MAG TPA: serine hydrolase domain-containing protein [Thermomicrobiales bacterium]|nr:serine hydrolase domain-containing protein [Thermomicrobiales bacterium]